MAIEKEKSSEELSENKGETENPPEKKKNTFIIMENYLRLNYQIRLNCITNEMETRKIGVQHFEPLNENALYREMQHEGILCKMNDLLILLRSDYVAKYNPILEYFEQLPNWNKSSNHILEFASYVKTIQQERFYRQLQKMLVRVIACALNPKVVNKQALVLVHSKQNSGKTTWIRYLCPPKLINYFTENMSLNKDGLIAITENWIINLDELAMMNKGQIDLIKSILSQETVKVRHPYDRKAKTQSRICSFFGSTNQAEFLTDETGSVRWLCFEIEAIDWGYTKIPIDLVWAQAYYLYKNGFDYQLTSIEIKENEKANKAFLVNTKEMELIMKYLKPGTKENYDAFLSAMEIIQYLQGKYFTNINLGLSDMRMGKALNGLNFQRESKFNGTFSTKGYYINF